MKNFHPLDVLGRGRGTHHQVGENINLMLNVAGKRLPQCEFGSYQKCIILCISGRRHGHLWKATCGSRATGFAAVEGWLEG